MRKEYFFSDGITLYAFYNYENHKKNGEFKEYYHNGIVSEEGFYVDNKLEGDYKCYQSDGSLEVQLYFKNGKDITKKKEILELIKSL
jgi:antitoxin component YwqK of YwqJK toxin-antitoxin module